MEYVDYRCRYQVLCSFVVKMPRPHGNCKFRNEWLAIDKFKDWVARDRADDKRICSVVCEYAALNAALHNIKKKKKVAKWLIRERCESQTPENMPWMMESHV